MESVLKAMFADRGVRDAEEVAGPHYVVSESPRGGGIEMPEIGIVMKMTNGQGGFRGSSSSVLSIPCN